MKNLDTFYVPRPDEDEDGEEKYLTFRLWDDWVSVDGQKLIMPVTLLERNGRMLDDQPTGLLSQYGGHSLLTQLLLDLDSPPEKGDKFILEYDDMKGFVIRSLPSDD